MNRLERAYTDKERLRNYSSIFSSRSFSDLLKYNDYSFLNIIAKRYDKSKIEKLNLTYIEYIKYIYKSIAKDYRCEYVYKNTILNKLLIGEYGTINTIAINEFRVGNSIADLALFNGVSKVFEIKTEYDSKKRLPTQLSDYTKLFQECYLVVSEDMVSKYISIVDESIGIISIHGNNSKLSIEKIREAKHNDYIDVDVLMQCLRTQEYKNIVIQKYGELPTNSCFEMYEKCANKLKEFPSEELQRLFIQEIKKRKNNTNHLKNYPEEIRQLYLSMNIKQSSYKELSKKLNQQIIL